MKKQEFLSLSPLEQRKLIPEMEHIPVNLSEFATAYISHVSEIIGNSIIKTMFAVNDSESVAVSNYLWKLLSVRPVYSVHNSYLETMSTVESRINSAVGMNLIYPHDVVKVRRISIKTFTISRNGKQVKVRIRVPIKPEKYTVKSVFGKIQDEISTMPNSTDKDDIISEVMTACIELVSVGMIESFSDVWKWKKYLFSAGQRYVRKNKRSIDEHAKFSALSGDTGDTGERREIQIPYKDSRLEYLDTLTEYERIQDFILSRLSSRANSERFKLIMGYRWRGYNNSEIARMMDVSENSIRQTMNRVMEIMQSADGKKLLSELA